MKIDNGILYIIFLVLEINGSNIFVQSDSFFIYKTNLLCYLFFCYNSLLTCCIISLVAYWHGMTSTYHLPKAVRRGGKAEGGGCYGLDDLIGPLKPMYQTSNRPEKKLTLYCVICRQATDTCVWIHTFVDTWPSVTAVVNTAGGLTSSKLTRPFGDVTLTTIFSVCSLTRVSLRLCNFSKRWTGN